MNQIKINPQPIIKKFGRASQEEIGEAIGVSRPTVSAWLNSSLKAVDLEMLGKFCKACDAMPQDFFLVPSDFCE